MERRITPGEARLGMYVRSFGGAWLDHPFWRSRFILKTDVDVEKVRQSGVPYLVIDDELGLGPAVSEPCTHQAAGSVGRTSSKQAARGIRWTEPEHNTERFERQRAKALLARSTKILRTAFADVRLGRAVRMDEVSGVVDEVLQSVDRTPRTLLEMLRLKKKDEYTYMHSVAVCTLMVNVARHLGKSIAETREYGLAGLLHDLGKMGIDDEILNKAGKLTQAEFSAVRNHPEHGYQILAQSPGMPEMALDVCRHHHEKIDGTGYPFGLPENAISLAARLGAICDVYDALTSERVYKNASTPVEAVSQMWNWEGHFDPALLFTFMQSIGVFPLGMVVQLRSNRLALVLENKRRSTRPRVFAFYDTREHTFVKPEVVVIDDGLAADSVVAPAKLDEWGIADWDRTLAELKTNHPRLLAA